MTKIVTAVKLMVELMRKEEYTKEEIIALVNEALEEYEIAQTEAE